MALAVSGGSDSVAMLRLARDWALTHHPGLQVSVLTVDHALRDGSAEEARQVAEWAAALGFAHHMLRWDHGERPVAGIQAKARVARYDLMTDWCRERGAGVLLTAHTLDDQAETVMMRLARTASPESLAGIWAEAIWKDVPVLRPLLGSRREALRDYLRGLGQAWIEDPSNLDTRFERVRVRKDLAGRPDGTPLSERLAALAEASARTVREQSSAAEAWLAQWLTENGAGVCEFPLPPFQALSEPLQMRILARIIDHYGGGQAAPEPEELRRLARWAAEGGGAQRRTLGGAVAGRRRGAIWVTREAGRIPASPALVPDCGKLLWDKRFLVEARPGSVIEAALGRPLSLPGRVPVHARRAYPVVSQPPGVAAEARIVFQPLLGP